MNVLAFIREWLVRDAGWKIFSLLLAIAIWLTVNRILQESALPQASGAGSTLTVGSLPVDLVSTVIDVRDYRLLQNSVSVTVSGSADAIGRLQANQIHAIVNLNITNSVIADRQRVEVFVPPGITVDSISPDSIGVIAPLPR
jgi:hypothetical protein